MIRKAREGDIPALVAMGAEFIAQAGHDYDRDIAAQTLRTLILGEKSVVLVKDDCSGMLGGLVYQHFFGPETVAQELFWWSRVGGLALLEAFETWAREQGAQKVMMIALEALSPERVGRIYQRRGYEPLEHTYVRRI